MPLDADFVETIERPKSPILQQALSEACTNTAERLAEMGITDPADWLVRKLAFAYFHDHERDSPEYALVLPDPGHIGTQFTAEIRQLSSAGPDLPFQEQLAFYRNVAKQWYLTHETDFPQEFLSALRSHGLITYSDDWQSYIRNDGFFDDFYMTDVLKYRVNGYTTGSKRESRAVRRHLKQELIEIDPNVIFVFGNSAWQTIRTHFDPEPVTHPVGDSTSIMAAHGDLYCTATHVNAFVLPLGHMSGQVWWRFPPDEYVERLEAALAELREVATDEFHPPADLCETDASPGTSTLDEIAERIGDVSEFDSQ